QELSEEREGPTRELNSLYRDAGLDPGDLATVAAAFAEQAQSTQSDEDRTKRADQASAALRELLGGGTAEELTRELETARDNLRSHEQAHGKLTLDAPVVDSGPSDTPEGEADDEIQHKDIEIAEL